MKKILLLSLLIFTALNADYLSDGNKAYEQGDKKKASQLLKQACDGGDAGGCSNLGLLYRNGEGVRQDKKKASQLFKKACDGGNTGGCSNLGFLYENGIGVRQNKKKGLHNFTNKLVMVDMMVGVIT